MPTRPLLAVLIAAFVLGGTNLFMRTRVVPLPTPERDILQAAPHSLALDVTATGDLGRDAFSLDAEGAPSLAVHVNGAIVFQTTDAIPAGTLTRIEDLQGLNQGHNEILVEALLSGGTTAQHAVRVDAGLAGQALLESQTSWFSPSERLVQVRLVVPLTEAPGDKSHAAE